MSDPLQDFMATRASAGKGDDAWMRDAAVAPSSGGNPPLGAAGGSPAAGGAAAQSGRSGAASPTAAPVSTPAAGTSRDPFADDASQPFGLRFANMAQRSLRAQNQQLEAEKTQALPGAGGFFTQDLANAWNTLVGDLKKGAAPIAGDETLWGAAKNSFARFVQTGKSIKDAASLALSPIAGIFDEATGAAAKGLAAVTPGDTGAATFKRMLDTSLLGLGGEGEIGKLADAEKTAADGAAAARPPAPPREGGGGGAPAPAPAAAKPERAFDLAGEEPAAGSAPLKITPEIRQSAANFLAGRRDNPIDVHLDQLADDATRNDAVMEVAKIIPKESVKPLDISEMGAYSLNLSADELMTQIRPKFPSDETFAAAAMLQNSASKVFWDSARKAMETGAPEDAEAATRAYALFNKYTGAFRDAKTDWGRAGRIQQQAMGARSDYTKSIQDVIANIGPDNVEQVIKRVANLDDPAKASAFVSGLRSMSTREALLYGWYNVLLSHAVVVKKVATDLGLAAYNVPVRYVAEKFGSGGVAPGEALALWNGYRGGMSDAIRAAGKGLRMGQSQFLGDAQSLMDGHLLDRAQALQAGTSDVHSAAVAESPTMSALEKLRMFLPTSAMAAADDFGKAFNYRAELHSLAWREGSKAGLEGDALAQHISTRLNNVLPDMHAQAASYAMRNTLTEPLEGFAEKFQEGVDALNIPIGRTGVSIPLGRMVLPFTKVSVNALRYAYRNSPLPLVVPSASYRAAMAAGGAERDLAQAQVGIGTAVSMIVGGLAINGTIDGAGPSAPDLQAAWRRAGHTPYTLRVGDENVRYDRVEPMASLISVIADTHDLMRYAKDEDGSAIATSLVLGIGHAVINKTYMSGLSDFLDAVHSPDQSGARYAQNLLASMAMPGDAAMLARGLDPFLRTHRGFMDSIWARTPGISETLPPMRDLWGQPIARETLLGPLGRMASPVTMQANDQGQPIDKWIWAHREDFPNGAEGRIGMEPPGAIFAGENAKVKLSAQQLDRLKVLSGNETKDPSNGLGAKDALNALVQGEYPNLTVQQQWNRSSPARQAVMVANMWREYREAAKGQLFAEDKKLQSDLNDAASAHQRLMAAPTFGGN